MPQEPRGPAGPSRLTHPQTVAAGSVYSGLEAPAERLAGRTTLDGILGRAILGEAAAAREGHTGQASLALMVVAHKGR